MSAKRNLQLVTPYLVCSLEGVAHGFYLLWVTVHRGIPAVAATAAIAGGDLALLVLEVPTGIFADRLGARRSLVLGSAFQVLGLALFWQARSIPVLVAAVLAVAFGDAFRSGADQALIYRSCAALGQPDAFGRVFARAQAWALVASVGLTALGGWIAARVGFDAAWVVEVALAFVGLVLACGMTEVPAAAGEPEDDEDGAPALPSLFARVPWALLVPATVVSALDGVTELFVQITPERGVGVAAISAVIAAGFLLQAIGSALVARGVVPIRRGALDAIALVALVLVGLVAVAPRMVVPALAAVFLATGIAPAIRAALVQRVAADGERATIASAASAVDMLGGVAALPFAAWLHERLDLPTAIAILACAAFLVWALAATVGHVTRRAARRALS